jgi:hypothetical protein
MITVQKHSGLQNVTRSKCSTQNYQALTCVLFTHLWLKLSFTVGQHALKL